ncbi:MAG: BatD family protein [Vicinamibacterales bacterium]
MAAGAIFVALALGRAQAAPPPSIVSVTADPSRATVGDRITLTIVVDHDDATTVEGAGFGAAVGEFEIVAVAPPRTEPHNGVSRTTIAYTLTAFRTGDLTIPPQTIAYRGPDGSGTMTTGTTAVQIVSVLAPGETDLRPLKPQIDLKEAAPSPVVPALFVAGRLRRGRHSMPSP